MLKTCLTAVAAAVGAEPTAPFAWKHRLSNRSTRKGRRQQCGRLSSASAPTFLLSAVRHGTETRKQLTFRAPALRTMFTIWLMVVPRTMESSTSSTLLPVHAGT
eukprot:scaffold81158_cov20-Tisochrysis_lutea.AAC.1